MSQQILKFDKSILELYYSRYNKRQYVSPDPLQFLYDYQDIRDREIVGLIASSLAYGRVDMILRAVSKVLDTIGPPRAYFMEKTSSSIERDFLYFTHRFTKGRCISKFMIRIKEILNEYGSIKDCFLSFLKGNNQNVLDGLEGFSELFSDCKEGSWCLIPHPKNNSPLKRMNLFLRWMVREDEVDPGGWKEIRPSSLIVPLDIHMFQFSIQNGLLRAKAPSLRAALEITERFREISPEDPVKYDFVITRPGIWSNSRYSHDILT